VRPLGGANPGRQLSYCFLEYILSGLIFLRSEIHCCSLHFRHSSDVELLSEGKDFWHDVRWVLSKQHELQAEAKKGMTRKAHRPRNL